MSDYLPAYPRGAAKTSAEFYGSSSPTADAGGWPAKLPDYLPAYPRGAAKTSAEFYGSSSPTADAGGWPAKITYRRTDAVGLRRPEPGLVRSSPGRRSRSGSPAGQSPTAGQTRLGYGGPNLGWSGVRPVADPDLVHRPTGRTPVQSWRRQPAGDPSRGPRSTVTVSADVGGQRPVGRRSRAGADSRQATRRADLVRR